MARTEETNNKTLKSMKTSQSTTENTTVKFKVAETLAELQERVSDAEIVKLANDYLNRHHFLPTVRAALRREVTAKTEAGIARQEKEFDEMFARIDAGEEFDLYEFTPTRREAKDSKAKQDIARAVEAERAKHLAEIAEAKLKVVAMLMKMGCTQEEAEAKAADF